MARQRERGCLEGGCGLCSEGWWWNAAAADADQPWTDADALQTQGCPAPFARPTKMCRTSAGWMSARHAQVICDRASVTWTFCPGICESPLAHCLAADEHACTLQLRSVTHSSSCGTALAVSAFVALRSAWNGHQQHSMDQGAGRARGGWYLCYISSSFATHFGKTEN
jgi:hypothetical protein